MYIGPVTENLLLCSLWFIMENNRLVSISESFNISNKTHNNRGLRT